MSVYILQENGDKLLQDNGSGILYESLTEFNEPEVAVVMVGNRMVEILVRRRGI